METRRVGGAAPEGPSGRGQSRNEGSSRQRRDAQMHRYLRESRSAQAIAREPSFCRDFVKASKPALMGLFVMCFFLFLPLPISPLLLFRWLQCGWRGWMSHHSRPSQYMSQYILQNLFFNK